MDDEKSLCCFDTASYCRNSNVSIFSQNSMLAYQQMVFINLLASIMVNTHLSQHEQVFEIIRQMLTHSQTAGPYVNKDEIKEVTRVVRVVGDRVQEHRQKQQYGSPQIRATAKEIATVGTDAASGVTDSIHGIDKDVEDN